MSSALAADSLGFEQHPTKKSLLTAVQAKSRRPETPSEAGCDEAPAPIGQEAQPATKAAHWLSHEVQALFSAKNLGEAGCRYRWS
jgi:hypothetical protein